MSWGTETAILLIVVLGMIAYIPALVAKRKGYSFITWWVYSWLLSVAAIIHVAIIPDKKAANVPDSYSLVSDAQTEDKNLARYRLFASIFAFLRMAESVYFNYIYGFDNLILADYISIGFFIGLTLSLLLGRKIIGLCFSIPFILSSSYYFLLNLANEEMQRSYDYPLLHIASLFDLLTYVTLAAAFIMSIKKDHSIKSFWFWPAAFSLATTAVYVYVYDYVFPMQYYLEMQWLLSDILWDVVDICGLTFTGLWLSKSIPASTSATTKIASLAETDTSTLDDSKNNQDKLPDQESSAI